jgi:hypothetical protein
MSPACRNPSESQSQFIRSSVERLMFEILSRLSSFQLNTFKVCGLMTVCIPHSVVMFGNARFEQQQIEE